MNKTLVEIRFVNIDHFHFVKMKHERLLQVFKGTWSNKNNTVRFEI